MKKKFIIYTTIIILINNLSCTSLSIVSNESLKEEIKSGSYLKELHIQTQDSNYYYFESWSYRFEDDTLYGSGTKINLNSEESFEGKIPVVEISFYETKQFDILKTSGLLLTVAAIVIIGSMIAVGASLGSAINRY